MAWHRHRHMPLHEPLLVFPLGSAGIARLMRPAIRTQISMVFKSPLLRMLELATRGRDKASHTLM
eukprot:1504493-Amphidinium_carterae.1